MAITEKFKSQAYNAAFGSFVQYMNKIGQGFNILLEGGIIAKKGSEENRRDRKQLSINEKICFLITNNINWGKFHNVMKERIEQNYAHMRQAAGDENYDYLVHCVNTFIQVLVEQSGWLRYNKGNIPPFEKMGEKIFTQAARKVFGSDFSIKKQQNHMPQNKEEEMFVMRRMKSLIDAGRSPQEACQIAIRELMSFRNIQMSTENPYYINKGHVQEFEEVDDWNPFDEEEDEMYGEREGEDYEEDDNWFPYEPYNI